MEKLARKLASKISASLNYDAEKEAVIAYGLIAIIQIAVTVLMIFIIGLLLDVYVEALIVCFSASIMRKYSGGAHAGSAELCTSFSIFYCLLTALVSKRLLTPVYHLLPMAAAAILIFALSLIVVYKKAPVDSPNKPIRTEKKIKRMRKGSFIILALYLVLSAVFFILGFRHENFRSYGISMLFGLGWQTFTLINPGALFIGTMNKIFIKKEVRR
ncbi:MAG: accessory gene regulator ArgB-like protein [Oscillospiraceae bacterium]|jgi:accessory gene regulator B